MVSALSFDLDMGKYIDADKLISEVKALKRRKGFLSFENTEITEAYMARGVQFTCDDVVNLIQSLQQEQPESSNGKFVFPNYLYARTVDNKIIDVSYAPQSLDAVEYIKNDPTNSDVVKAIEYIRKDTLLEWLNQRKKLMEEEIGFGLSIDNVIDKLNSM